MKTTGRLKYLIIGLFLGALILGVIPVFPSGMSVISSIFQSSAGNIGIGSNVYIPQKLSIWDGNVSIQNSGTLGGETLNEPSFTTHVDWGSTGDFNVTGGNAAYTHATGVGTITQSSVNLALPGRSSRWYKFVYTVSGVTSGCTAQITNSFAATAQSLNLSAGVQTLYFLSSVGPGDFVISATSTAGGFTLDDFSLKEIQGGSLYLGGDLYFGVSMTTTGAGAGTITNVPTAGNPSVYIKVKIGNNYYGIPAWTIP